MSMILILMTGEGKRYCSSYNRPWRPSWGL